MKKISVIIVNHNGKRFLEKLLGSIYAQTFQNFEVIFVDNGSTDDSTGFVRENFSSASIIQSENIGYGVGCNAGARAASGELLVFLNEDMYLPKDFFEKMLNFREGLPHQEKVGAISCKMVDFGSDPEKTPASLGANIDFLGFPVKNKNNRDIFAVSGSPFFIKKDLFEKIGGFNELIFLYGEDIDLSWRLKICGFENYIADTTHIHHFAGGATGNLGPQKIANIVHGAFISIFTNYCPVSLVIVVPVFLVGLLLFCIFLTAKKLDVVYPAEIVKKIYSFLKNFKTAVRTRKSVQKKRIHNDIFTLKYISLIPAFFLNNPLAKLGGNYTAGNA